MKTLSTFLKESQAKSFEGYAPTALSYGLHSVEEIGENGLQGHSQDDVNEGYHNEPHVRAEAEKESQGLHDNLVKHYSGYSDSHKREIHKYTINSSIVNNNLHAQHAGQDRNGRKFSQDLHDQHSHHIRTMDSAMKAHKTPADMHVYSGTSFSPARYKTADHKAGDPIKVHLPGYSSTSINKHEAESFSDHDEHHDTHDTHLSDHTHMLKIHVPAGHPGAYVDHHSKNQGEREFIMPRNTKLHVKDAPEIQNHGERGPVAIWHAHIHHD